MEAIIFSLPGNETLSLALANQTRLKSGQLEIRDFPDGETYIRFHADVRDQMVILVCSLDHPNAKTLPVLFAAQTAKQSGAKKVCLITPYLPYMRQDKEFKPGEAVSCVLFADLLSNCFDSLITIDPHLHRIHRLADIYQIPQLSTLHSVEIIAAWINKQVTSPFLIGPDEESQQWVAEVARLTHAEFVTMQKIRLGDTQVNLTIPDFDAAGKTPVFVDDIISTGSSILTAIHHLKSRNITNPVCVCVHALFTQDIYTSLMNAGAVKIVSCNTIAHFTNEIDISGLIAKELQTLIAS